MNVTKENVKAVIKEIKSDCGLMKKIKDYISWEMDEETRIDLYCKWAEGWLYDNFDKFWEEQVVTRAKKNNQDPEDYFYEYLYEFCDEKFNNFDDLRHGDYCFWVEHERDCDWFYVYKAGDIWPEDMYLDAGILFDLALNSENPNDILEYIETVIGPMLSINSDPILTWDGPDFSSEDLYLTDDEEYVIAINEQYGTTESFTTSYEYPSDRELRLWILEHFDADEYDKVFETDLDYIYWDEIDSQCHINSEVLYLVGAGKYIYKRYSTNVWYGKYAEYVTKEFAEEWITEHFDEEIREEYLAKLK